MKRISLIFCALVVLGCETEQQMMKPVLTSDLWKNPYILTLRGDGEDALTPINKQPEWSGWAHGWWEKRPDSDYPPKPPFFVPFPYADSWDHWFYAHAPSRIVWNLPSENAHTFACVYYLPNDCLVGDRFVEVLFFVDDTEVYRSGELMYHPDQTKSVSFDVPAGTSTLTLEVRHLADPICDHFVFGNPRLLTRF